MIIYNKYTKIEFDVIKMQLKFNKSPLIDADIYSMF